MVSKDTIAAIATASGKGGIGIVRLSGDKAKEIGCKLSKKSLRARYAHFCELTDNNNNIIDEGIVLYFPKPHSFTGEDVVELQAHGSPIVLDTLLTLLL